MRLIRLYALAFAMISMPFMLAAQEISNDFSKTYKAYNVAYAQGNFPRAAELAQKALDLAKKELGPDHEKTAVMEINLAHVLVITRQVEKAEPLLRSALKKVEKIHGKDHLSLVTVYEDLAKVFASKSELDKSRLSLSKAISIIAKHNGADNPEIAGFLIQKATIDIATQKLDEAQKNYEKALSILNKKYGVNSINTASTISLLGDLHLMKKEFPKAEEFYKTTLKIYGDNLVEDDPTLLAAHVKMAKIFIAMRDDRFQSHADRVLKYMGDEEGEALPMFIMQPLYPVFKDGVKPQGWVLLQFDVNSTGKVENAKVVESLPARLFDKVSLDVAKKWRFKPKFENGKRIKQSNTRARLVFTRENIEVHMGEMKF